MFLCDLTILMILCLILVGFIKFFIETPLSVLTTIIIISDSVAKTNPAIADDNVSIAFDESLSFIDDFLRLTTATMYDCGDDVLVLESPSSDLITSNAILLTLSLYS